MADTIEEAHSYYIGLGDKKNLKAVVIRKPAPDTGHEAGEFRSKAIAVIQINKLEPIKAIIDKLDTNLIVVDPQRKTIYQLPEEYSKRTEKKIIQEGLFSSSLSSDVSAYIKAFTKLDKEQINRITPQKGEDIFDKENLGDLIQKAHSIDTNIAGSAINKISSFIVNNIENAKGYNDKTKEKGENLQELKTALTSLNTPDFKDLDASSKKVKEVLKTIYNLKKQDTVSQEVFIQTMLGGAEMLLTLDKMAKSNQPDLPNSNLYQEYLNICTKFQGVILSQDSSSDILGSSVIKDLANYSHNKYIESYIQENNLEGDRKNIFLEASKLQRFFINEETGKKWLSFCSDICKTTEGASALSTIVGNIVKNNIHSQWCNLSAASLLKNGKNNSETLLKMSKECESMLSFMGNITEIDQLIREIKSQTNLWNNPEQFKKLNENFSKNFNQLEEKLKFKESDPIVLQIITAKQMMELVDSMDLTLKSLGTSTLYQDKQIQAENFQTILKNFGQLLDKWIPSNADGEASRIIRQMVNEGVSKEVSGERDLSLSGEFNVSAIKLDTHIKGEEGWRRLGKCRTLQDCFTLIHQNLITSISLRTQSITGITKDELPKEIKDKIDTIQQHKFYYHNSSGFFYSGNFDPTYIEVNYPKIILNYNLPLNNHSATANITYDNHTKEAVLGLNIFGYNTGNRWNVGEDAITLNLKYLEGMDFVNLPKYNENNQTLSFVINIANLGPDKLKRIIKEIEENVVALSFDSRAPE